MHEPAIVLTTIGAIMLLGLATDLIGRRTPLPRITLLIVLGFVIGPAVLDVLPRMSDRWFTLTADIALVMVGFLIGGSLTRKTLRRHGRAVLVASALLVVVTFAGVLGGLGLLGFGLETALVLAAVATATDPIATLDVVRESKREGPFRLTLIGIVAVDDAWGLIAFTLALVAVGGLTGQGAHAALVLEGAWELVGALLLGVLLGVPMAFMSGRLRGGEPLQAEALGMVLLCGGLAIWLEISFLLAAMVMGAVVANLAAHHRRPFHAIEGIEWPFMVLFFVLAGAKLDLEDLRIAGWTLLAYTGLRMASRVAGGWLGARVAGLAAPRSRWLGVALMPQAGVALGMALVASQRYPGQFEALIPVAVASTVVFEVVGPVLTRMALRRVGEEGGA